MKFSDMLIADPEALRRHYWSCRELAYNNAQMAQHTRDGSHTRRKLTRSMGYLMRQIEMCERAADRRGFSLAQAAPTVVGAEKSAP